MIAEKIQKFLASKKVGFFCVFALFMLIYHSNARPICQIDCIPATYTAWSLIKNHNFDISKYPSMKKYVNAVVKELPDGQYISCYPQGSAIAAVPFVLPYAIFRQTPPSTGTMRYIGKITASSYVALSAAVIYMVCLELFPSVAVLTAVLYGLGTCLWSVASQGLWMHGPAVFFLCLPLYFLLTKKLSVKYSLITGFFLGAAIMTRPILAFFAIATGMVYIYNKKWVEFLCMSICIAIFAGLLIFYNATYFHNFFNSGYSNFYGSWMTPLWLGLSGLLIAPSRGLFVYSPALILFPCGLWYLIRYSFPAISKQVKSVILLWFCAAVGIILLYSKWNCWWGALCFGPRFLCEMAPILCILFAVFVSTITKKIGRMAVFTLVCLSVFIQFLGVFGNNNDWNLRYQIGPHGRNLFSFYDTQIQAHTKTVALYAKQVFNENQIISSLFGK